MNHHRTSWCSRRWSPPTAGDTPPDGSRTPPYRWYWVLVSTTEGTSQFGWQEGAPSAYFDWHRTIVSAWLSGTCCSLRNVLLITLSSLQKISEFSSLPRWRVVGEVWSISGGDIKSGSVSQTNSEKVKFVMHRVFNGMLRLLSLRRMCKNCLSHVNFISW